MLLLLTRGGLPNGLPVWPTSPRPDGDCFRANAHRQVRPLSPLAESTLTKAGGLILLVRPSTSKLRPDELRRSWVVRAVHAGKRKRIGLGRYPAVGLAQAREKAAEAIRQLEKGQDPTRKGRARLKAEIEAQTYTFKRAVDEYLAEAAPTLKHPKSEAGRTRGLKAICAHLNDRLVEEIGTREIAAILKSPAASRNGRSNPHRA